MKILVVEDEHRIANAIKKGLEIEHYIVDVAYSGGDGESRACTESYDIMIFDIMLPEISGIEICRVVRKKNIHTPILLLTAKDQVQDKLEGFEAGADDYLTKPFAFEELLARVRALSRRPQTLTENVLQVEDLLLDQKNFVVQRQHTEVQLSGKEYALLEYLMRNAGKILKKEQIIAHVWDYDADILPNTVEVYIRNLRKKIDEPFHGKPLIETVRGFGYRLGAKN